MQSVTIAKLGLTAAVAAAGFGFLVYSSAAQAQHYRMVDELIGDGLDHWRDTNLRVHGLVKANSIVQAVVAQEMHQTFVVQHGQKEIRVFSHGPLPDTFKDGAEVVVSGHLAEPAPFQLLANTMCRERGPGRTGCPVNAGAEQALVVEATEVSAKCPSRYNGAEANQKLQTDHPFHYEP